MTISPGSAHRGVGEWLLQRLSAVYLAGFVMVIGMWLVLSPPATYAAWHAWFYGGVVRIASALFVLCLLLHIWLGLRSVFMDYVRHTMWRTLLLLVTALGLLVMAIIALAMLLGAGT